MDNASNHKGQVHVLSAVSDVGRTEQFAAQAMEGEVAGPQEALSGCIFDPGVDLEGPAALRFVLLERVQKPCAEDHHVVFHILAGLDS